MDERIIDRLIIFIHTLIREKKIKDIATFERKCGFYKGYIANTKRGKGCMDGDAFSVIAKNIPELDMNWLVSGQGDMMKNNIIAEKYKIAYESSLEQINALNDILKLK